MKEKKEQGQFRLGPHLASGMDCQAPSWMVNEGRWRCCHFPVNVEKELCWPEQRTLGKWHSGACAARSVAEDCGSEAALYAWR